MIRLYEKQLIVSCDISFCVKNPIESAAEFKQRCNNVLFSHVNKVCRKKDDKIAQGINALVFNGNIDINCELAFFSMRHIPFAVEDDLRLQLNLAFIELCHSLFEEVKDYASAQKENDEPEIFGLFHSFKPKSNKKHKNQPKIIEKLVPNPTLQKAAQT